MPINLEYYEIEKRQSLRVPISSTAAYVLIQLEVIIQLEVNYQYNI